LSALLFGHGAYTEEAVAVTASALHGYALGLPALCAARPLIAATNALQLGKTPVKAALISMGPLILVSIGGIFFSDTPKSAALSVGLGLSTGAWCNVLLLLRHINVALQTKNKGEAEKAKALQKPARACLGYLAVALIMAFCLSRIAAQNVGILLLPGLILVIVVCWFALFLAFKNEDARALLALFRKKQRHCSQ
jgi:peptidoglycan biosynthesis protein MviN/MurJ (putative lipid II flippase)